VNKKLLIIIPVIVVLVVATLVAFNIKKGKVILTLKAGNLSASVPLLNQAKDLEAKGDLLSEKTVYQKLVSDFSNSPEVMSWQKKIEDINTKSLFSPAITPKSVLYEVKPGDTLTKIAKEYKTTADLIKKSNNLSSDALASGKKIKVWTAPFTILVDKSQNTLYLKSDEEIFKTYVVSTGKNNCTPVGTFKIVNKLMNPTWFKEGKVIPAGSPDNILGTRWLGFDIPKYGIHGTTDPQSLGKQVTSGCVRMSNSDVEELYIIIPVGTEVTIVD
jgi:lipoprotein-anchoring transpeptidase ErfK/SrfK